MSLVNDMLRDLDQRRRESEGSVTAVKLTPASEFPRARSSHKLFVLLGILLVLTIGLGYVWLQLGGENGTQTLDIRPAVVDTDNNREIGEGEPESAGQTVERQSELTPEADVLETEAADTGTNTAGAADNEPPAPTDREPVDIAVADSPEDAVADSNEDAVVGLNEDVVVGLNGDAVAGVNEDAVAGVNEVNQSGAAPAQQEDPMDEAPAAVGDIGNESVIPDVIREGDSSPRNVAPVRDAAAMSPQMRDTLAVQEALRLIADNRQTDAYAHLEKHIIDNRYAHQSRETYAKLLLNQDELLAAYNLVESGLALAPNHAGYKKVKARILIANGRIDEAVDLLSSRAPTVNEDIEYHELLATAQLASRDYEGALISYTGLVRQNRGQGKWWYGYAVAQDSLGNESAAQQAYNRAVEQANLSPNLRRRSQERLAALSE